MSGLRSPRPTTLLLLALLCLPALLRAQGPNDLLVTPPRVVLEPGQQNVTISLINKGTDTNSYVMSMVNYRMTEEGNLELISEPDSGQLFAERLVRFFPRQVTLAPKEEQTLRVQLFKPAGLPPGEYRSHLWMRAVPRARAVEDVDTAADAGGIQMRLRPIYGIVVPIIVRNGSISSRIAVEEMAFDTADGAPSLTVRLARDGDASSYGDLVALWQPPGGGTAVEVGLTNGVAVYTPNRTRTFQMRLRPPEGIALDGGSIVVEYRSRSSSREQVLARSELTLP